MKYHPDFFIGLLGKQRDKGQKFDRKDMATRRYNAAL